MKAVVSLRFFLIFYCFYCSKVFGEVNDTVKSSESEKAQTTTELPKTNDQENKVDNNNNSDNSTNDKNEIWARNFVEFSTDGQVPPHMPLPPTIDHQLLPPLQPPLILSEWSNVFNNEILDQWPPNNINYDQLLPPLQPPVVLTEWPNVINNEMIVQWTPNNDNYVFGQNVETQESSFVQNNENLMRNVPGESQDLVIDNLIRSRVADLERLVLEIVKFTQLIAKLALNFVSTTNAFGEVIRPPFFTKENMLNMKVAVDLVKGIKNMALSTLTGAINDLTYVLKHLGSQPSFGVSQLADEASKGVLEQLRNVGAKLLGQHLHQNINNNIN